MNLTRIGVIQNQMKLHDDKTIVLQINATTEWNDGEAFYHGNEKVLLRIIFLSKFQSITHFLLKYLPTRV